MKILKVRKLNIFLLLASLLIALLICEGLARIFLPQQQLVKVDSLKKLESNAASKKSVEQEKGIDVIMNWVPRGIRLKPNMRATIRNHSLSQRDITIETNSVGLRYDELAPKRADEYRVLLIGDSITFGDYLAETETISRQMESLAGIREKELKVINAGLPAMNTTAEFYHYLEIRDAVEPDLVLVGMYLNDAQDMDRFVVKAIGYPFAYSRLFTWLANRVQIFSKQLWKDSTIPEEIQPEWREEFRGGRKLKSGYMFKTKDGFDYEIYNAHTDFGLAWNPAAWKILRRITRVFSLAAKEAGHEFAVFLFPVHIQVKGSVEDFYPQEQFKKMCSSLGITCYDLLPALRTNWQQNKEELFYDHCHYRPYGNKLVARALINWLDEKELLPASKL